MPIDDPTAIPETSDQAAEYLREADDFWSNHRQDEAVTLYFAVLQSPFEDALPQNRQGEIMFRLGQAAERHGDQDRAYRAYLWGQNEGHDESRRRLAEMRNELPDQDIDPDVVPSTIEAVEAYLNAGVQIAESDPERAARLLEAALATDHLTPGHRANASYELGLIYQRTGSHDAAYQMFEEVASTGNDEHRQLAIAAMRQYQQQDGTDHDDVVASGQPTDEEDAGRYLQAAIDAYDRGDTGRAEALATVVASSSAASAAQQGGAHYYLGAIAYYANNFDVARTHLTHASEHAEDPYRDWAQQMLDWRWQEG